MQKQLDQIFKYTTNLRDKFHMENNRTNISKTLLFLFILFLFSTIIIQNFYIMHLMVKQESRIEENVTLKVQQIIDNKLPGVLILDAAKHI